MAKTLDDLERDLLALENRLLKGLIDVAQKMALNLKAYADRQLKEKGIPGYEYSTNSLPAHWLYDNTKTIAAKKKLETLAKQRKKTDEGISYKDLRQAEGLQTGYVDLTFTGKMMQAFSIIETKEYNGQFVAVLGGTNKESIDKLKWAKAHYGNFIFKVVGQDGMNLLKQIAEKEIPKLLKP